MGPTLPTLLLLALPASGKSELRRYLDACDPPRLADLHLAPPLHLDDYPYVHLMRRISAEMSALGEEPAFFASGDGGWLDPRDWGTLIHLLNEDYEALTGAPGRASGQCADRILDRLDAGRRRVGAPAPFALLPPPIRTALCAAIEDDAAKILQPTGVERGAHTVVIEFARGGPEGPPGPVPPPAGYAYSLARLSEPILASAAILYVWVGPAESRRRNRERARPGPDGDASILHHGVPEVVMRHDYGRDDMDWLIEHSDRPGTVAVAAHGRTFHLPVVRFDNRADRTSFLRADPDDWDPAELAALHRELAGAFQRLAASRAGAGGG